MPALNEINEELQFNVELMGLLDVMKSISVFRFRTLQAQKRIFTKFDGALKGFFGMVDLSKVRHPFINPRAEKSAILIITSDAGFMGGLNLNVIEMALGVPEAHGAEILVVGERGEHYLRDVGRKFTAFSAGSEEKRAPDNFKERYRLAVKLKDHILGGAKRGKFGKVFVFYPKPLSFIVQKVNGIKLLPAALPPSVVTSDVIIESPLEGIIDYLVEEDMLRKLIDVLEDSKMSEYASRAIHLEESTGRLQEKEKEIRFRYFRVRHELIDKNIRELFSAQVIRKKA